MFRKNTRHHRRENKRYPKLKDNCIVGNDNTPTDAAANTPLLNSQRSRQNGIFSGLSQGKKSCFINIWQDVVNGEAGNAYCIFNQNPQLLFEKGAATEHTERMIHSATPFQVALCCGDLEIAKEIQEIALKKYSKKGQKELYVQFKELFPDGYAAHVQQQQQSVFKYDDIVTAITKATPEEVNAALRKETNDSVLCQALVRFRTQFDKKSLNEKVFNPYHLLTACRVYQAHANWDWGKRDLFWRQVIGYTQRHLTIYYKQALCQGLYELTRPNSHFRRQHMIGNCITHGHIQLTKLDDNMNCRLGYDFATYSFRGAYVSELFLRRYTDAPVAVHSLLYGLQDFIAKQNSNYLAFEKPKKTGLLSRLRH